MGTMTGQTKQTARTVIFEATAEYPQPFCIQGGSNGFTWVAGNRSAVELKRDGLPAVNLKVGMVRYSQIRCHLINAPF
jgi:hypothetical protein